MMRRLLIFTTILYWCAMFVLTHLPPAKMPQVRMIDKFQHLLAFALLGAMICLVLKPVVRHAMMLTLLIGAAYGAVDELTQPLVGRSCQFTDWLSDLAGITLGSACVVLMAGVLTKAEGCSQAPGKSDQAQP